MQADSRMSHRKHQDPKETAPLGAHRHAGTAGGASVLGLMLPIRHRIYRFGAHSRAPVAGHALHAQATMTIELRIDALFVGRDGIGQFPAGKIEQR